MTRAVAARFAMVAVALVLAGCSTADPTSPSTQSPPLEPTDIATATADATAAGSATPPPTPPPSAAFASPDPNAAPALELVVDGQPYRGTVGGYTWGTYTQSAPWHPATGLPSITVAHGATLSAVLAARAGIDSWSARVADAADPFALAVTPLGRGDGLVVFEGPAAGDWVLELRISYADGAGDGAYYWHLVVE